MQWFDDSSKMITKQCIKFALKRFAFASFVHEPWKIISRDNQKLNNNCIKLLHLAFSRFIARVLFRYSIRRSPFFNRKSSP